MKFFLCVLGLVMIVEGLPYFAFPEKMKIWIEKIVSTPENSLRRFGFVLMALGMCLIYFGRTWAVELTIEDWRFVEIVSLRRFYINFYFILFDILFVLLILEDPIFLTLNYIFIAYKYFVLNNILLLINYNMCKRIWKH